MKTLVAAVSTENKFGICTEVPSSCTEEILLAARHLINRNAAKFIGNYSIHVEHADTDQRGKWLNSHINWL